MKSLAKAALALYSFAACASDVEDIVRSVDIPAGMHLDLAIFSTDGLCAGSPYPGEASRSRLRFHAASISKLFTATVLLQLQDEGRLELRDPVGKYLPEFATSPIRLEDLLTHTSGLGDRMRADGRSTRAEVDEYIRKLSLQKAADRPGARWAYADSGYNLLGRVVENITKRDFATVMQERLLTPLSMSISTFMRSEDSAFQSVRAADGRGRPLAHPWDLAFAPSSGLQSDAQDLARFGAAILAIAAGHHSPELLSRSALQQMTTVRIATDWEGISQGYGWQLSSDAGDVVWRHAGGEAGFESLLAIYPQRGFGVIVMGNRKDWPRFKLTSALVSALREGKLRCGEMSRARRAVRYSTPGLS